LYAQAMSGFIQWLAKDYKTIAHNLAADRDRLATSLTSTNLHKRTPRIVADLGVGLHYFLLFAKEVGAISDLELEKYWREWSAALVQAALAQEEHQREANPALRFLELVTAAVRGGEAHLASISGTMPINAITWGWQGDKPQGKRIGWIEGRNVFLIPDQAYSVANALAEREGEPLNISRS
jgi:hypothetical protein